MKREFQIFLTALMFYTRIPCPKWVDHNPKFISLTPRYFPLMGWIVGGVYAMTIVLLSYMLPSSICVVLGLIVSVLLTGAFHEDGFADACDGFGGGWTREQILYIMKDSRIGTYGGAGLILIIVLKIYSTLELFDITDLLHFISLIISSHSLSRLMAVVIMYTQPYARTTEDSKAKPATGRISFLNLALAIFFGATPFVYFLSQTNLLFGFALAPMIFITFYLARYFQKWIGGYTGDCLGATQQVNEVIFLLSIVATWRFM